MLPGQFEERKGQLMEFFSQADLELLTPDDDWWNTPNHEDEDPLPAYLVIDEKVYTGGGDGAWGDEHQTQVFKTMIDSLHKTVDKSRWEAAASSLESWYIYPPTHMETGETWAKTEKALTPQESKLHNVIRGVLGESAAPEDICKVLFQHQLLYADFKRTIPTETSLVEFGSSTGKVFASNKGVQVVPMTWIMQHLEAETRRKGR